MTRFRLVGNPANVDKLGKGRCEMPNEWPDQSAEAFSVLLRFRSEAQHTKGKCRATKDSRVHNPWDERSERALRQWQGVGFDFA